MTRRGMAFALVVAMLSAVAAAQAYAPHCDDGCDDAGWSHTGADGRRKRSGDAYAEGRYGVWIPSDDSGQCTVESNCRDHLQECDDQRADGRSRRNRSPERRSGNGFENESFLHSVCSQGVGSNLASES
jgi:hypothetical protein